MHFMQNIPDEPVSNAKIRLNNMVFSRTLYRISVLDMNHADNTEFSVRDYGILRFLREVRVQK